MKKYNGKELYKGLLFIKSMMSIHYSQIEQGRHRMSLELMLKIVTKYGVDPNTLFGIESREKHENKDLSVLEDKLQMLKPNDREYAMSTCLIFIEGLEARKEVV